MTAEQVAMAAPSKRVDLALWAKSTPNETLLHELRHLQRKGLLPVTAQTRRRAVNRASIRANARARPAAAAWVAPGPDAAYVPYDCRRDIYVAPTYRHRYHTIITRVEASEAGRVRRNRLSRRRKLDKWRARAKKEFDQRRLQMELEEAETRGASGGLPETGHGSNVVTLDAWLHSARLRAAVLAAEERALYGGGGTDG